MLFTAHERTLVPVKPPQRLMRILAVFGRRFGYRLPATFLTSDLDRLVGFYQEVFGARNLMKLPVPEPGGARPTRSDNAWRGCDPSPV